LRVQFPGQLELPLRFWPVVFQSQGKTQIGACLRLAASCLGECLEGFVLAAAAGQQQPQVIVGPRQIGAQFDRPAEVLFGLLPALSQIATVAVIVPQLCVLGVPLQGSLVVLLGGLVVSLFVVQHGQAMIGVCAAVIPAHDFPIGLDRLVGLALPFQRTRHGHLHVGLLLFGHALRPLLFAQDGRVACRGNLARVQTQHGTALLAPGEAQGQRRRKDQRSCAAADSTDHGLR
jgi:hypothetical protein